MGCQRRGHHPRDVDLPLPPAGYFVYRGTGPHPWKASWRRLNATARLTTGMTDTGELDPARRYYYRVTALRADGSEGPPSLLARIRPAVVRRTVAARASDGSVELSWEASESPGVVGYHVYRAQGGAAETLTVRSFGPDGTSHTEDDITAQRSVVNLKGMGKGIKKNISDTAEEAAKGAVKGLIKGAKEGVKDVFRKKNKESAPEQQKPN